ncbi:MAG: hypothetical protein DDT30_02202 [Dehalococcoidia bacterium]|nr:hypothetical protein [Bacillota bacterium]
MKVVSDTGPLIGLAKIDHIFLLKSMAEAVFIPPMIYRELLAKIGPESDRIERALHDFISVNDLAPLGPEIELAIADLDEGEKEAIGLASILGEDVLLLLDDRAGRKVAEKLNIPTTGLVGLLLLAKGKGLVANVVPLVEELRNNGYWLSDTVINVARRLAGE